MNANADQDNGQSSVITRKNSCKSQKPQTIIYSMTSQTALHFIFVSSLIFHSRLPPPRLRFSASSVRPSTLCSFSFQVLLITTSPILHLSHRQPPLSDLFSSMDKRQLSASMPILDLYLRLLSPHPSSSSRILSPISHFSSSAFNRAVRRYALRPDTSPPPPPSPPPTPPTPLCL